MYLKINVQTFDVISEFKMFKSFCGLNVQLILAAQSLPLYLWSWYTPLKLNTLYVKYLKQNTITLTWYIQVS